MVVLGMIDLDDIHEALEKSPFLVEVVSSVHPWVIADCHARGQLELFNFCQDSWVLHAVLFDTSNFINIHGGLVAIVSEGWPGKERQEDKRTCTPSGNSFA